MAVEMDGAEPQSYEALFDLPGALISDSDYGAQYDVTADGQRFLLNVQRADVNALTVVLDLASELERRMPRGCRQERAPNLPCGMPRLASSFDPLR